eukprot:bmy_04230T0
MGEFIMGRDVVRAVSHDALVTSGWTWPEGAMVCRRVSGWKRSAGPCLPLHREDPLPPFLQPSAVILIHRPLPST